MPDKIENNSADMALRHALKLMAATGAKAAAMTGIATAVMSVQGERHGVSMAWWPRASSWRLGQ